MSNYNIPSSFLDKARSYLDNPLANIIATAAGVRLDKVRSCLNSLSGITSCKDNSYNNYLQVNTGLNKYRAGLAQLQHR